MWAQSAKQKTKSQLHNTFKKKEILSFSVIGSLFSALHIALTWNDNSTRGLIRSINMAAMGALISSLYANGKYHMTHEIMLSSSINRVVTADKG